MKDIIWNEQSISRLWKYYSEGDKRTYFAWHSGESLIRFLLKNGIQFNNMEILDFGCGNGYMYEWIMKLCKNFSYTGADTTLDSINYMREHYGKDIRTLHIDSLPLSCEEEAFDIVLVTEVIEHVDDTILKEDMQEWMRLLKRGGKLVITTPNDEDMNKSMIYCPNCDCQFHRWQHVRKWTSRSLEQYVREMGYKVVFCKETMLYSKNKKRLKHLGGMIRRKLSLAEWPNLIMVCEKQ